MSDWQQYDYDKDGYLESGRELRDYNAAYQTETKEWLDDFHQQAGEAKEGLKDLADDMYLRGFWDATQNGAHYLMLAGQGLADTAVLVARAAEVVDWLGTAFKWLGYIVPGASAIGDLLDRVENVSEEKALKASTVALGILVDAMTLASAGWDAMLAGRVTDEAYNKAKGIVDQAVEIGQGITDVLFGD
jgi:hypothetical protein